MALSLFKEQNCSETATPLYREQILGIFKTNFIKSSEHGASIDYEELVQNTISQLGFDNGTELDLSFLATWYMKVDQLSYLTTYLHDEEINELLIHNSSCIHLDSNRGTSIETMDEISSEDYQLSLEILARKNNQSWNYATPFVSFFTTISDQFFRATLIHFSAGPNQQSKLFLRKIRNRIFPIENYLYDEQLKLLILGELIPDKKNILISGSTGSGKTSFLKTLLSHTGPEEHLIVLEDTHELTPNSPLVTNLLASEQLTGKTLKDYCAYSLRMRPDRIIIGEMRSQEVIPFILAMNTGHKGLISTIHANSASDTLSRLSLLFSIYSTKETLSYQTIMQLICKNIDYVIHLENKRIKEVIQVLGAEGNFPIFEQIYHA